GLDLSRGQARPRADPGAVWILRRQPRRHHRDGRGRRRGIGAESGLSGTGRDPSTGGPGGRPRVANDRTTSGAAGERIAGPDRPARDHPGAHGRGTPMPLSQADDRAIHRVVDLLRLARRLLFVTGAGLSADSGMPTYRGPGGLYNTRRTTPHGVPI